MAYDEIVKWAAQNPTIIVLGFLATLASFIFSIVFFVVGRRLKRPLWMARTRRVIHDYASSDITGLTVSYNGTVIPNLTSTMLAFWNGGKETIDKSDFADLDKFRIIYPADISILSVKIVQANNPANNVRCHVPDGSIEIECDFIDYKNGFVVQILHTGDTEINLGFAGIIKGVGHLSKCALKYDPMSFKILSRLRFLKTSGNRDRYIRRKVGGTIIMLMGLSMPLVTFFDKHPSTFEIISQSIMSITYFSLGLLLFRTRIPGSLKAFYSDI